MIRAGAAAERVAWVLSNHDFPRLVSRFGAAYARLTAMLLLTLPGTAFVYQGDEIGMTDGPGVEPPVDRLGRDGFRHPMQWEPSERAGFTTGTPWIPPIDPDTRSVTAQEGDPASMLELYRELIVLRRGLGPGIADVEAQGTVLSYRRGDHLVALNLGEADAGFHEEGEVVLATGCRHSRGTLVPGEGVVLMPKV